MKYKSVQFNLHLIQVAEFFMVLLLQGSAISKNNVHDSAHHQEPSLARLHCSTQPVREK
jgi:hypothetical protein